MRRVLGATGRDRDNYDRAEEKHKCFRNVYLRFRAQNRLGRPSCCPDVRRLASHTVHILILNHGRCLASGFSHATGFNSPVVRQGL
jgi:hypothetical protein